MSFLIWETWIHLKVLEQAGNHDFHIPFTHETLLLNEILNRLYSVKEMEVVIVRWRPTFWASYENGL